MKRLAAVLSLTALFAFSAKAFATAPADTLVDVRNKKVLVAGVRDCQPPFGYFDKKSRTIIGYDVDFINAIAKKLGVRVELKPVTSANRVDMLKEGAIDIIAATMTKTPERAMQIDFSHTYFFTGQKFLTRKGIVKSLKDLEKKKIGTDKGSTSEQNVMRAIPTATILLFKDFPQAFIALQKSRIQAITSDEAILAGILSRAPDKAEFEIPPVQISDEPYGLGMRKGDRNFVDFVNKTLLEMEKNGEAKQIFDRWFGSKTDFQMQRNFKITVDK